MQKIVYRPKFCSFEPKIGQLDKIMEKKRKVCNKMCFLNIMGDTLRSQSWVSKQIGVTKSSITEFD